MESGLSKGYLGGTLVAVVLASIGAWLPWLRKRPAGHIDGQPYYTGEYLFGLNGGFQNLDLIIFLCVLFAVGGAVLWRELDRHLWGLLITVGIPPLLLGGRYVVQYRGASDYTVTLGPYLVLISGLLLIGLGLGRDLPQCPDETLACRIVSSRIIRRCSYHRFRRCRDARYAHYSYRDMDSSAKR